MRSLIVPSLLVGLLANLPVSLADGGDEGDVFVGVVAGGQLAVELDFDQPVVLPPSDTPPFLGFFFDDPGFTNNLEDEPDGFLALPADAELEVRFTSIEAGFKIYNDDGAFTPILEGGAFRLSPFSAPFGSFDTHPYWHIDTTDPTYPGDGVWTVGMQIVDVNGTYAASDVFTVDFVPEPSSLVLIGMGALALYRRGRQTA